MTSTEVENERRLREYIAAWNNHDIEGILDFFADDVIQAKGEEPLTSVCETWFEAFPDLTHDIKELAADGAWVLGRFILRGTHEGPYKGVEPTGDEIEVSDHASVRFVDGDIAELHATADTTTLLEQLGVSIPPFETRAENKALVRQYFTALNDRDREAFVATMANNFTYGDIEGPEEMADRDWEWLAAMDLTWDIQAMHANESFVTTRVMARGTHQGEILGLAPTGHSFEVSGITLSRIEDGQIVEWWADWDFAGLLNQIGAIDSPVYRD